MNHKVWFPKLINLSNFISNYVIMNFEFSLSDEFFILQILGFEDNARVGSSLFKLDIEYEYEIELHLNILFIFHLKYKYHYHKDSNDLNKPWNFKT